MTYVYQCSRPTCRQNWEKETEFKGYKTSCCHKCSNPECVDHKGGCDCIDDFLKNSERMMEDFKKRIAEGWIPPEIDEFGEDDESVQE